MVQISGSSGLLLSSKGKNSAENSVTFMHIYETYILDFHTMIVHKVIPTFYECSVSHGFKVAGSQDTCKE